MKLRSKYLRVTAATALLATPIGVMGSMPTAQADTTNWVATHTQAFVPTNATNLGSLPASTELTVVIGLQMQNQSGLEQYIQDISTPGNALYGQTLTPSQFEATYSPSSSTVDAVTSYLESQGLSNIQVSANRLLITATGTAQQLESAFNTQIDQFSMNGRTVYANVDPAYVPSSLGGAVVAVLGLTNAAQMQLPLATPTPTTSTSLPNYPASYNPQGFWKAYNIGNTPQATGTNIAIFAEGNLTQVVQDLRTEEAANQLPQVPYTIVQVGIASNDTSGADEWDLDTQYSTGMAGNVAHLYIYDTTSLTDSDIAREFNKFAEQDVAKAGSASFGECEYDAYLDGSMLVDDEVFAEAAAQGQTTFASAGDTGGFCAVTPTNGVPAGVPDVNYPASSPYVVAVGGTTLITNSDGSYDEELAWTGGGGGTSYFESAPYWQNGIVPPTTNVGKGLPDIAMDADPNSGANVYVDGSPEVVGGTSLASPLALGVWARLETSHNNQLGFAAPLLYGVYGSDGFHDITLGDSGPYPATPGWDFATGLGSFDVSNMNTVMDQYAPMQTAPAPAPAPGPAPGPAPAPGSQPAP
ncbi:S53 family peptidase [Alicyclobacillus tolerans]|uniref:Pseudomonalisin/xanthomonalisin n=1 Tax=Alicyclobacillus tolerans TaxID=90970 RepID=A0A1M6N784_9BACL|nr:S53 family peptidase [Alicyclobacillus montanus]SHJ91543.1 pseudomonalisin/xanthomonalisin [Alicyclobacillus montanus]